MARSFTEHEKDNIRNHLQEACKQSWTQYGYKKTSVDELCRQAGNGIVTNCVQLLGEHLYKLVKDPSFVCTDERMNGKTDVLGICNQMYMETV